MKAPSQPPSRLEVGRVNLADALKLVARGDHYIHVGAFVHFGGAEEQGVLEFGIEAAEWEATDGSLLGEGGVDLAGRFARRGGWRRTR